MVKFISVLSDSNSFSWRTHSCGELSAAQAGQSVTLCGWIQHKRFDFMLTLRDAYGVTQVVLPKKDEVVQTRHSIFQSQIIKLLGQIHLAVCQRLQPMGKFCFWPN